jgi:hypothetical protein
LVKDYGLVVISREGNDVYKSIYNHDILSQFQVTIMRFVASGSNLKSLAYFIRKILQWSENGYQMIFHLLGYAKLYREIIP